ncbi:MAG: DUF423 domain-containing protein [Lachnospiraceae bacterium]|nr:DUF423 domain-containing protein [Lachnospiraceae bacterium]
MLRSPSDKAAAYAALAILALLLLPLLRIAQYSVPWYDDFNYGLYVKNAVAEGADIIGALKAAFECVRVQWYAWQGTYSSVFFMALMPAVWGEEYYFLGPLFLIIILTVSVYTFMHVILTDIFEVGRYQSITVSAVTAALCIVLIHSSQTGFYWYNGGVHYVGMHSFLLLLVSVCIRLACTRKISSRAGYMLLGVIMAVCVAGSNYVTALQGGVVIFLMLLIIFIFKRSMCYFYVPIAVFYLFGFYKNVAAPGNRFRSAAYEGWGYSPAMSVIRSFAEAFKYMGTFTGWMTVAVMAVLLPVIVQIVRKSKFRFNYPALILAASFCLYATGFTPSLYSLGHAGLGRTLNAVKITFQLLLVLDEVYITGWAVKHFEKKEFKCPFAYYIVVAAAMLLIFAAAPNQAGVYSSYGAYYYVHTGEAYNFYQEYLGRLEILKSDEENVVFKKLNYTPWLLCMGDLGSDSQAEENQAVASWYDKLSVVVE